MRQTLLTKREKWRPICRLYSITHTGERYDTIYAYGHRNRHDIKEEKQGLDYIILTLSGQQHIQAKLPKF